MLVFVVVVAISIFFVYLLILRARQVNLTDSKSLDQKPEWLATTPPRETTTATQADGEGITLFNVDPGERLAAPFAEQIEDIANELIAADPQLFGMKVDFGTAHDGSLEIWLGDKRYTDIAHLPDDRLRAIMEQAVNRFNEHHAQP